MLKRFSTFLRLLNLSKPKYPFITKNYTQNKAPNKSPGMANPRLEGDIGDLTEDLALEEKYHGPANKGGGGRGREKGGRGGKAGGGGNPQNRETQVSKALSKLLRHAAPDAGVKLDSEGYGRLDQVVSWHSFLQPTLGKFAPKSTFHSSSVIFT
jgi:hypothetical protein